MPACNGLDSGQHAAPETGADVLLVFNCVKACKASNVTKRKLREGADTPPLDTLAGRHALPARGEIRLLRRGAFKPKHFGG